MKRYAGEELPAAPRVAVVTNDALGNFAVATPLMQMLAARFAPVALDYFGGTRVSELAEASDLIDRAACLVGLPPRSFAESLSEPYDLVVNIERTTWARCATALLTGETGYACGPCIDGEGRRDLPFPTDARGELWTDQEWIADDIRSRYPFLDSGFIGEIVCRLAYLEGPVPGYRLPRDPSDIAVPEVLISVTASLAEKLWPIGRWTDLVRGLRERGLSVGLVGAKPLYQARYWEGVDSEASVIEAGAEDLRGRLTLPQVVGAIERTRLVVSIDNGIVHLASATDTPVVGLYRHGIHRLWAPPSANVRVVEPGSGGRVEQIPPALVWRDIDEMLG
jgi:ADP-heptose:LPS heptosyltransferase